MDANTSQPFILNRGDGSAVSFTILSPSSRIKFRDEFRLSRKLAKVVNLQLTGAASAEIRKELDEFDAKRLPESDVEQWVNHREGQHHAALLSLKQANDNASEAELDTLDLDDGEYLQVAAGVMRLRLVPLNEGEADKSNPTTAETAPTGDDKPAESATISA